MCKRCLRYEVNEKLVGSNIKTFDHLNSTVAEIEMFFADNPNLLANKAKIGKEKAIASGKEVNAVDLNDALGNNPPSNVPTVQGPSKEQKVDHQWSL